MPDAIFAHPRLASIYDAFDGDRDDLDAYVDIVEEFGARHVLDLGCGTGSLAVLLAQRGFTVTGVDPAAASLDVARSKPGAEAVTWIHGEAGSLPPLVADLAVMTGNVAQVFLSDGEWSAALRAIGTALRSRGHLVFETRQPRRRAWEEWAVDTGPTVREVPGVGTVEERREVTSVSLPFVSFRHTYRFTSDGLELVSHSTLRFRSQDEVEQSLAENDFDVIDVREAPDRPGREFVFVAQRTS